ncbi:MAG: hypothetical protein R2792_06580 [Saprospiraceae bacterium]
MRRLIFFLFLALFTAPDLGAQDSGNPFELTFRLSGRASRGRTYQPIRPHACQVPGAAEEFTAAIQTQTLPIDQLRNVLL